MLMSTVQIRSIFGFTFLNISYAHLALLKRFTFEQKIIFVGVGMWVSPVKHFRPSFGVSTISGRSRWFQ